jgi:hypothetical protein
LSRCTPHQTIPKRAALWLDMAVMHRHNPAVIQRNDLVSRAELLMSTDHLHEVKRIASVE